MNLDVRILVVFLAPFDRGFTVEKRNEIAGKQARMFIFYQIKTVRFSKELYCIRH